MENGPFVVVFHSLLKSPEEISHIIFPPYSHYVTTLVLNEYQCVYIYIYIPINCCFKNIPIHLYILIILPSYSISQSCRCFSHRRATNAASIPWQCPTRRQQQAKSYTERQGGAPEKKKTRVFAGKMWIFAAKTRECNQQKCGLYVQKRGMQPATMWNLPAKKVGSEPACGFCRQYSGCCQPKNAAKTPAKICKKKQQKSWISPANTCLDFTDFTGKIVEWTSNTLELSKKNINN